MFILQIHIGKFLKKNGFRITVVIQYAIQEISLIEDLNKRQGLYNEFKIQSNTPRKK